MRTRIATSLYLLVVVVMLTVPGGQTAAQETKQLTIEWMFGKEPEAIAAVPNSSWLNDGSLLLYDVRKPEAERFPPLNRYIHYM